MGQIPFNRRCCGYQANALKNWILLDFMPSIHNQNWIFIVAFVRDSFYLFLLPATNTNAHCLLIRLSSILFMSPADVSHYRYLTLLLSYFVCYCGILFDNSNKRKFIAQLV